MAAAPFLSPVAMAILKAFTDKLKSLRGGREVAAVAKERGSSPPTIYKAEGGEQNVKWQTIEEIYGDYCQTDSEFADLLMLWALGQTDRKLHLSMARDAMTAMALHEEQQRSQEEDAMLREMQLMPPASQQALLVFARHFRRSEHTRRIAQVWVESTEGWIKDMQSEGAGGS